MYIYAHTINHVKNIHFLKIIDNVYGYNKLYINQLVHNWIMLFF